jgi:endonuclease YncB( thermonuclease family)
MTLAALDRSAFRLARLLVAVVLVVGGVKPVTTAEQFSGRVVSVIDGDTVGVLRDGREVRVRLEGIDCPEATQDFGARAKHFTSDLVFGKTVTVDCSRR